MSKNAFAVLLILLSFNPQTSAQWQWLNPRPTNYIVKKIAFTDSQNGMMLHNNGDFSTTIDQGAHWNVKHNLPFATAMANKDSTVLACGGNKYYISSDNGVTWITGIIPSATSIFLADVVSRDTLFMAASNSRLYRSDDRGLTWKIFVTTNTASFDFINSKVGFIGATGANIFKTVDGGATWQSVLSSSISPNGTLAIRFFDLNYGLAFRERDGMVRTRDGGITWTPYTVPLLAINGI